MKTFKTIAKDINGQTINESVRTFCHFANAHGFLMDLLINGNAAECYLFDEISKRWFALEVNVTTVKAENKKTNSLKDEIDEHLSGKRYELKLFTTDKQLGETRETPVFGDMLKSKAVKEFDAFFNGCSYGSAEEDITRTRLGEFHAKVETPRYITEILVFEQK